MPEKTKNPFVVEIESESQGDRETGRQEVRETGSRVVVKEVVKPVVAEVPKPPVQKKIVLPEPEAERTKIQWGMFFLGVGVTLIIVAVSSGLWWVKSSTSATLSTGQALEQTTPLAPSPTPTPAPLVWARESIKVDVLNASGVTGKASEIATEIGKLGYKKGTTGNAPAQTGSTMSLSSDIASLSAVIKEELTTVLTGLTVSENAVKGTGVIEVVIGK